MANEATEPEMTIAVRLREQSYDIRLTNSYGQLPGWLSSLGRSRQGWVISHHHLLRRYGHELLAPLRRAGWEIDTLSIPETEASKSFAAAQRVIRHLARNATMRIPVLLAFGGGVVGDLTGFVASVFRRGVPYVQVPTTLLAQVDSAIGGKVGVDLPQGKNLIGAFYQPVLVCNNLTVLRTLPLRQRQSGIAEVIKYGMISDPRLLEFLEGQMAACLQLERQAVRVMVERSCRIKAAVVSRDERERTGLRARLNFGHTLGHALEAASGYRRWTHGEAIAIGMCAAAELGVETGRFAEREFHRLVCLIRSAGLPTRASGISRRAVLKALRYDKKFIHGAPRWVLPVRVGRVVVTEEIPAAVAERVIDRYLA
jgi:3-dehydroquinate synthase